MKNISQYLKVINSFRTKRILVIGDLLLDVYLKGASTRLCPEAPVPVVDVQEKVVLPGGAANTACNLRALGASVAFCTVIGNDAEGDDVMDMLEREGIDRTSIVRDPARKTITKSRIVSGSQIITRVDQGSEDTVGEETTRNLVAHVEREYENCDGIIISDYNKGVITSTLLDAVIRLKRNNPKFLAVDSKRLHFFSQIGPSLVKPNYDEAIGLLAIDGQPKDRVHQVSACAEQLYRQTNAPLVIVTLDSEGSVIIENGRVAETLPAPTVSMPHVAGAGDTFLSAFVLAYLGSKQKTVSAELATAAATISIRKACTATCSHAELEAHYTIHTKLVGNFQTLENLCDAYHSEGRRIVFTNGCFDILHSGHVTYLHRAKELGDVLIVGVNTDDSIKRIKGESRPINGLADRLKVLAGLSAVDHIIPFGNKSDDTPIALIRLVRPHVFAKGGDYVKEKLPEAKTVLAYGGEIVLLDHVPDRSTTRIINRISRVSEKTGKTFSELPS